MLLEPWFENFQNFISPKRVPPVAPIFVSKIDFKFF